MSDFTNNSDDEVFTGDLTLEEIKIHINKLYRRKTLTYVEKTQEDCNESLEIIEAHSSPDKVSVCSPPSPAITPGLWCVKKTQEDCNETLEIIELHSSPDKVSVCNPPSPAITPGLWCVKKTQEDCNESLEMIEVHSSPDKVSVCNRPQLHKTVFTPSSGVSPSTVINPKTPFLKTPAKTASHNKDMVTPLRKQYEHILSPVAVYIRKCPPPSLIHNVRPKKPLSRTSYIPIPVNRIPKPSVNNIRPKKPLSGTSYIPKPVNRIPKPSVNNIENVTLPRVAYRTAKETVLVEIPSEKKLPNSKWAKEVAASIPKRFVIKHCHRYGSSKKPLPNQDNSFGGDLSLDQADISVCIKKSAYEF